MRTQLLRVKDVALGVLEFGIELHAVPSLMV